MFCDPSIMPPLCDVTRLAWFAEGYHSRQVVSRLRKNSRFVSGYAFRFVSRYALQVGVGYAIRFVLAMPSGFVSGYAFRFVSGYAFRHSASADLSSAPS